MSYDLELVPSSLYLEGAPERGKETTCGHVWRSQRGADESVDGYNSCYV